VLVRDFWRLQVSMHLSTHRWIWLGNRAHGTAREGTRKTMIRTWRIHTINVTVTYTFKHEESTLTTDHSRHNIYSTTKQDSQVTNGCHISQELRTARYRGSASSFPLMEHQRTRPDHLERASRPPSSPCRDVCQGLTTAKASRWRITRERHRDMGHLISTC
jgi:hypothetical protein